MNTSASLLVLAAATATVLAGALLGTAMSPSVRATGRTEPTINHSVRFAAPTLCLACVLNHATPWPDIGIKTVHLIHAAEEAPELWKGLHAPLAAVGAAATLVWVWMPRAWRSIF